MAPHDARSVANLILDEADRLHLSITNLALQKLLYFVHAIYLVEQKSALVTGYFEAWQHGPVHPAVTRAFERAGTEPIEFRAHAVDILTNSPRVLPVVDDPAAVRIVERVVRTFGPVPVGRLLDIVQAKNAPWDFIVGKSLQTVVLGMRIPDEVIAERFRYHKIAVGAEARSGEPVEDVPFV